MNQWAPYGWRCQKAGSMFVEIQTQMITGLTKVRDPHCYKDTWHPQCLHVCSSLGFGIMTEVGHRAKRRTESQDQRSGCWRCLLYVVCPHEARVTSLSPRFLILKVGNDHNYTFFIGSFATWITQWKSFVCGKNPHPQRQIPLCSCG